jgi:fatty aldehyde-generating acyl-ACP reductase
VGKSATASNAQRMNSFAFMVHPIEPQKDVARKFPLLGKLPTGVIDYFSRFFPPVYLSHIVGIRSEKTGDEIEGWLVACPMTPRRMLAVPTASAYRKIIRTGRMAERLGASILGLGAFTSIVGDAGVTVSQSLSVPVTTGNSLTIAMAVEACLEASKRIGLEPVRCTAAVVGAYGSTGRACAQLLARTIPEMLLVGRRQERLEETAEIIESMGAKATPTTDLNIIRKADMVLAATSAVDPIIEPEHLKPGAVVCDVARPRNVSRRVTELRDDVLVIEGGVVEVPGEVDFGFDFGFPPGKAYACMAETMILALEGRFECYTIGKKVSLGRVDEIGRLAHKHGFRLAGFRCFERTLTDDEIDGIWERADELRRDV